MPKITVLGLGAMGSRLAINYRKAGYDVTVWNRTPDAATRLADQHDMTVAGTPRSAASDADVIVAMVSDNNAANSVWLDDEHGALSGAKPGSIAIESSTLTPDTVHRLGTAAASAGVRFVEAPVVGSRPQAEAGALLYLLAGEPADLDEAQTIIDINAGNSARVGPIGNAATLKLAINGLFAAQVAAYAEIVGFIERSDLDRTEALAMLRALPITSPGLQRILGLIEQRNYEPNFPVHLVAKDLDYLLDTADACDSETPVMATVHAVFSRSADGTERDLDIAGIAQHYQTTADATR
jgi:3-hydroxyisobutyrate dehydrogenase